ncbi:PAS domain S-box protein [Bacillus sp. JJ1533]|uniref:PAS domain-containing sensor histidine kinase n=1 Tax=Bacillus sp. JJ1533 TaxID=3122959 RepID=UPI002FFEC98F
MKYRWRILSISILFITTTIFKINVYLSLGYLPASEWILTFISIFPVWWFGFQVDKAKYYAKELERKDKEIVELFEGVDAVIYSINRRTNHTMVSSKISELYGYEAHEFIKNSNLWKEVIFKEDMDIVKEIERKVYKGESGIGEYRIQLPNGELKWVQKRVKPILDSNGILVKLNGIDIDIDKRKKVEELLKFSQEQNQKLLERRLEETEQRFKSLFVHNSDAIFTFNLDGKLIEANEAGEELLGYKIEDLKKVEWESVFVSKYIDLHREYFQYVNEGKQQECTVTMIHKDGSERVVSLKMIPIIIDNQLFGIYEIAKDMTEAIFTEEMIRRSDKLSVVGQLAAGVAHEIRNPLTTLKGFVQLFKSSIDKQYVDVMLTELDRINLIVSEFLILSKPQATKYEHINIKQILNSIISLLMPHAILKNIQFHLEIDNEIPFIRCEQNQLKQVFINIVKNAIEAMPQGGNIHVKINVTSNEMVNIQIIDEGVGIDEEQIPKLGEPFFSTKENGTGLGLMVSFRIIENHGGTMKVSSQLNKGTTIDINLPINPSVERV